MARWERDTGGYQVVDGLFVGQDGVSIAGIRRGTVSINPASIATLTKGATIFTLTGARAGDMVLMIPPATLEDDLIPSGAIVTADDTVTVYLYNPTLGAVDGAALTWTYVWFDLTE